MRIRFGVLATIVAAALICSGLSASGQSITFLNYSAEGGTYPGIVNGQTTTILCDDDTDNVIDNETWNVTALQASTLTASNIGQTLFGGRIIKAGGSTPADIAASDAAALTLYTQVAYLANALLTSSNQPSTFNAFQDLYTIGTNSVAANDISYAIWALTSGIGTGYSANTALVYNYVTTNTLPLLSTYTNLWIYTPNPPSGYTQNSFGSEPQEMWGTLNAPEGGASLLYLLLAGAACFGAMVFSSRNQIGKQQTA